MKQALCLFVEAESCWSLVYLLSHSPLSSVKIPLIQIHVQVQDVFLFYSRSNYFIGQQWYDLLSRDIEYLVFSLFFSTLVVISINSLNVANVHILILSFVVYLLVGYVYREELFLFHLCGHSQKYLEYARFFFFLLRQRLTMQSWKALNS